MVDKIKGLLARIIIKSNQSYCEYCILDTVNKNINGVSYTQVYNAIGKYFSPQLFAIAWLSVKCSAYITQIKDSDKYIVGARILVYPYEWLL